MQFFNFILSTLVVSCFPSTFSKSTLSWKQISINLKSISKSGLTTWLSLASKWLFSL